MVYGSPAHKPSTRPAGQGHAATIRWFLGPSNYVSQERRICVIWVRFVCGMCVVFLFSEGVHMCADVTLCRMNGVLSALSLDAFLCSPGCCQSRRNRAYYKTDVLHLRTITRRPAALWSVSTVRQEHRSACAVG